MEINREFSGHVVLVTGSTSGIGERTIERFAALGATVVVNSSSSVEAGEALAAKMATDHGVEASYVQADISDADQARAMIDSVVERHGQLDIVVNNAGWTQLVDHRDLDGLTDEIFQRVLDVNVFGTWVVSKAAIPHLLKSSNPNIINITSVAGVRPIGSSIAYSVSKAALNQLTKLLAKSFGPIRVNAVAPGLVATPWTEDWQSQHDAVKAVAPIPRSATAEDCAEAVLAFARNRYTTGDVMVVDGGLTLKM